MHTQLQKQKGNTKTAATVQQKTTKSNGFSLEDNRATPTATQLMAKAHGKSCGCSNCAGATQMKAKVESNQSVAQLTCDAGHKQHKKGPCPDTPEGKMLRMQKKHGGGKPHGRKAKARPKKRQAKYDQQALDEVIRRQNGNGRGPGPGPAGAGAGVPVQ